MNIQRKLVSNYLVAAILLMVVGGVSLNALLTIRDKFRVIISDSLPSIIAADELMTHSAWAMKAVHMYLELDDTRERDEYFESVEQFHDTKQVLWDLIAEYETGQRERGAELLKSVESHWDTFTHDAQSLVDGHAQSVELNLEKHAALEVSLEQINAKLVEFKRGEQEEVSEAREEAEQTVRDSFILIALCVGIALIIKSVANYFITRSIVTPIRQLRDAAQALGEGDLKHRAEVSGDGELSSLAVTFNAMADEIQKGQMELERKVTERTTELHTKLQELEQMNETMVGRELKMVEMKRELAQLKQERGLKE